MSNEGFKIRKLIKMVEEKEVLEKKTQVEEGDECYHPNLRDQQFVLLLKVTQANGRLQCLLGDL